MYDLLAETPCDNARFTFNSDMHSELLEMGESSKL